MYSAAVPMRVRASLARDGVEVSSAGILEQSKEPSRNRVVVTARQSPYF